MVKTILFATDCTYYIYTHAQCTYMYISLMYMLYLQETFAESKETIVALSEADVITLHSLLLQSNHYDLLQSLETHTFYCTLLLEESTCSCVDSSAAWRLQTPLLCHTH